MIYSYLNKDLSLQDWKKAIHRVRDVKKLYSMLKDNLYQIVDSKITDENSFTYQIALISDCSIYNVHFPGKPITPGACLIEIAKELIEDFLKKKVKLTMANNVKFIAILEPGNNQKVDFLFTVRENESQIFKVDLVIQFEEVIFAKMILQFE
jgi:3-hydroxyacyl-[acyl-carrier-protein] dehydratase